MGPITITTSAAITPWWDHQVLGALIAGLVAILVLYVNSRQNASLQDKRLRTDQQLARDRFDFEREMAQRALAVEQWRRRVDFAEQQLKEFYEVRSRLQAIRSPMSFGHEAAERPGRENESEQVRKYRDVYYPVLKRFNENAEFFNKFYSKRYLATALLGVNAEAPYQAMWQALVRVNVAVGSLMQQQPEPVNQNAIDFRDEMKKVIWEGLEPDTVKQAIDKAVDDAEALFQPVIQPPPA